MSNRIEEVNEVMDSVHTSANAIYEHLVDGDKVELDEECDQLIAQIKTIKAKNA